MKASDLTTEKYVILSGADYGLKPFKILFIDDSMFHENYLYFRFFDLDITVEVHKDKILDIVGQIPVLC